MKLMRYGAKGREKPALVDAQGQVRDLSAVLPDITAQTLTPEGLKKLREVDATVGGLRVLELSEAGHRAVLARCRKRRIRFMSTPFDEASADFLAGLGMTIFKIPSGEVTNHPLLRHIARNEDADS